MNQRNQLRAALKERTLDELFEAKDLPRKLTKSYTLGELKSIKEELDNAIKEKESRKAILEGVKGSDEFFKAVRNLALTATIVFLLVGPWTAFARQPEPVQIEEQQIAQLLFIEAYISPLDFAPFDRTGEDCPNVAVIVDYNSHFLFEATASPDLGPKAEWDTADLPHEIYISYFPDDVFTIYLVHIPDLEEEQRDTIAVWEINLLDPFSLFSRHLFTENGSYVIFIFQEAKDKPKLDKEPEEEGEGYFEADEAGIIIKSW